MAKETKTKSEKTYPNELQSGNCFDLVQMLGFRRPSRKQTEPHYAEFLDTYIKPVMGDHDGSYNFVHIVTEDDAELSETTIPRIAYMAHHDTVHRECSTQFSHLRYMPDKDGNIVMFVANNYEEVEQEYEDKKWDHVSKSLITTTKVRTVRKMIGDTTNCLGADCTAGVWLILEMIKAKVPGVYVIHNDEEIGRVGAELITKTFKGTKKQIDSISKFPIAKFRPEGLENGWAGLSFEDRKEILPFYFWIDHVDIAMSFDRKGYDSIITKQRGSSTASIAFADELSSILSKDLIEKGYPGFKADPTGSYTDSASYDNLIKECTNLSVGYFDQHTEDELQDLTFILTLRDTLIKNGKDLNNPEKLGAYRDPLEIETFTMGYGHNAYRGYNGYSYGDTNTGKQTSSLTYLTYNERMKMMAQTGLMQQDNEGYYAFDQRLREAYEDMQKTVEKKIEATNQEKHSLEKTAETKQITDQSASTNKATEKPVESKYGDFNGVEEEDRTQQELKDDSNNDNWVTYLENKYGITPEELADPDFDISSIGNEDEEDLFENAVIESIDANWTSEHEKINQDCMDDDTLLVLIDYAISLGATHQGLINHLLSHGEAGQPDDTVSRMRMSGDF